MKKDEYWVPAVFVPEDMNDYRHFINFLSRVDFESLNVKNIHIEFDNKNGGLDTFDYKAKGEK